ncbi:GMC oxidoreductase [Bradyrhizobium prioriisuperbiae]|uniref:GMC oxidoreductase n=1 Tax=Bradyrhizobium prioriisuperbiae TaxID=2854389 RepID=UPI0028EB72D8|nr:GMC oxidoreductase [Bradyrhizobium prioritasuperba]
MSKDDALEQFIRRAVFGVWQPLGARRIGDASDPQAVVDPVGNVIGIGNIDVADVSGMPRLPTATCPPS